MRWLLTLLLLALVAAGGAYLLARDRVLTAVGLPVPAAAGPAESLRLIDQSLQPDRLTALRVGPADKPLLQVTRTPAGGWTQPGNWPLREAEVNELVAALAGLRTRFAVTPLDPGADLSPYGLAAGQQPVEVQATTGGKVVSLRFGRPPADPATPDFARPTYLRADDLPEVVRLGPDVYPLLARPADVYRRRQLVAEVDRVRVAGGEGGRTPLLGDAVTAVKVERTDGPGYTLKRVAPNPAPRRDPDRPAGEPAVPANELAAAWVIEADAGGSPGPVADATPVRDRVDPAKLRTVLAGVPDLWADRFPDNPKDTGLDAPSRTVTLSRADGRSLVVQIGNVSRSVTKTEAQPPPSPFGPPPAPPKTTTEEYRFARLKDNPLVFEVRTDKLADLFADPADLRDAQLARFTTDEVTGLTVARKGEPPLALTRKRGNKDAENEADKQDRWLVGDKPAEAGKVTELLDALAKLEAKKEDRLDGPDPKKLVEQGIGPDSTRVTVTAQGKAAEGDPAPPARTYAFVIGKDDPAKKKLAVRVEGWDRVNLVDDAAAKLIDRPALAYRGRRLFEVGDAKLETVTVTKDGQPAFALGGGPKWAITQPVATAADEAKAGQLAGDLSRLEAVEFVDDAPRPEDVDGRYGLAKPRYTVALGFAGKPVTLEVGKARDGKPEAFARLAGQPGVFSVGKPLVDSLDAGAVGLLPLQLWTTTPESVTSVAVTRPGDAYTLTQPGDGWKLTGPFEAAASFSEVQPLLAAVATVKADKADALVPEPRHGLDKPAVELAVTYKDGDKPATKSLKIGAVTGPDAKTRFARAGDGPVFVVPDTLLAEADKPALTRLTKSVLSLDPAKLTKVAVAGPTPEASVTLVKAGDKWTAEGAAFAVDEPTVTALVTTAARPPVARLLGYDPAVKWADLGLDKPEYTLTLTLAGDKPETHTVKVGKADAQGERPVRADDGPAAGALLPRASDALAKGKLDLADRTLLAFDPAALTAIKRTAGKDELELTQAGPGWELAKPSKQKADKSLLDELADRLGRLRATRVAAFDPKDLAPFGLDQPAAVLTLTAGDKPLTLKVGGPVADDQPAGDRYAAADAPGKPVTVGVLPAELAGRLLAPPLQFRDRALAPKFVDADKVVLKRGDRTATFEKQGGTWKLTAPVAADAESADLDELVTALGELRADVLAADAPKDLEPFGLAEPQATLTLSAGGSDKLTLLVGGPEKDGKRVHAKAAGGSLVGLLDPTLSSRVQGEFRKRQVFADLDPAKADVLTVSAARGTFSLRKQGPGWGPDVDAAAVTDFLAAVAGLKAERFAADGDADPKLFGLDTPSRVIVVTQRGVGAKTLQLGGPVGGSGGKRVYARVPDRPGVFELSEAATATLTRDRAAFGAKK